MSGQDFHCDASMVESLRDVLHGAYDVELAREPKVILDIGANAGAFCVRARAKWPKAELVALEPNAEAFAMLVKNLEGMGPGTLVRAALTPRAPRKVALYAGMNNQGEASLQVHAGYQDPKNYQLVDSIHPAELPLADLIKLDVEGEELAILENLTGSQWKRLQAIVLEIHHYPGQNDEPLIHELIESHGLRWKGQDNDVHKFVRP